MFKNIKKFFFFLLLITNYCLLFTVPALAQNKDKTKEWTDRCVYEDKSGDKIATIQGLECIFYNVLQVIVTIAGFVFLFMFIINGFKYLFSSSDQKKLAEINSSITMAVIGLVGIIISWLILLFINRLTGLEGSIFDITIFKIPG